MYPFHYSIIQSNFPGLKVICAPSIHPFLPTTSDLFTDSIVLPSQECQTVGIIQSEALSDWFLSLGDMCLSFLNVFSWLNSLFKSRDTTLPTKVHVVKAMVFPVVMYGCESWTVKKAGC